MRARPSAAGEAGASGRFPAGSGAGRAPCARRDVAWRAPAERGRLPATLRKQLTLGERFEREWEAGSDLTLEEAVALALDEE